MRWTLPLALLAIASAAGAVPTKGNSFKILLPGTTSAKEPVLAGTVVTDVLTPFTSNTGTSGTVQVRTTRNKEGKLIFSWKINVAPSSKGAVSRLFILGFYGNYDANWRSDGLGTVAPTALSGFYGKPNGQHLVFEFDKPIAAGQSSRFMFLRSSSTKSQDGKAYVGVVPSGVGLNFKIQQPAN